MNGILKQIHRTTFVAFEFHRIGWMTSPKHAFAAMLAAGGNEFDKNIFHKTSPKDRTMDNALLSLRLDKVERQVRAWRTTTIFSLILCAASVVTHLGADPNWIKTTRVDATAVVAQEFDLVNPSGRVTARLAPLPDNPDSPYLALKYPNDKAAISIGVESTSASSVSVLNGNGLPRIIMHESANGPDLSLFDEDGRPRVIMDAFTPGPQISIYDKARKRTVVASSN